MRSEPAWQRRKLEELAQIQTGIAKGKAVPEGSVELPYLRVANVQDGYVDLQEVKTIWIEPRHVGRFLLRRGDVLFTEGGDADKLGRGCVWRGQIAPCLHQNHVFAVRVELSRLLPEYLSFYASSSFGKTYFLDCAKQTTNLASINTSQLKAFPVSIPPLREQRKIVTILSAMDGAIETAQAVISQLRVSKNTLLADLLTRGIPGRHTKFKQTKIGVVPKEWAVVPLGHLAELQSGYPFRSVDFASTGDRLLRGSNVGVGFLDWAPSKTVFFPAAGRQKFYDFVLEQGDIVVAMDRPFISDGFKIARVTGKDLPALLLQRVGRLRNYRSDREFVWCLLHSEFVQGHLKIQQKGTDLPHISKSEIEGCLVPQPPQEEQEKIGKMLSVIDARITIERSQLVTLRSLRSSIMSVLLSGEVRVIPDEQPA